MKNPINTTECTSGNLISLHVQSGAAVQNITFFAEHENNTIICGTSHYFFIHSWEVAFKDHRHFCAAKIGNFILLKTDLWHPLQSPLEKKKSKGPKAISCRLSSSPSESIQESSKAKKEDLGLFPFSFMGQTHIDCPDKLFVPKLSLLQFTKLQ